MCLCVGACIAQWILYILNFILSIGSLCVLAIGVVAKIALNKISDAELDQFNDLPTYTIVVGLIFTAIFFFGCCGALCRNSCMLVMYAILTIIFATATVVGTVFVFKGVDKVKDVTQEYVTEIFNNPQSKETFQLLETALGCCGTTGPDSYNGSIPMTCCPSTLQQLKNPQELQNTITDPGSIDDLLSCSAADAYQDGCLSRFTDFLSKVFKHTGTVLTVVAIVEYVAAFLALFLTCCIKI